MTFWLRHITRQRSAWLLLGLSAVFLEVCALLFQHVLGLRPCLMCIYERLVVLWVTWFVFDRTDRSCEKSFGVGVD